MCIHDPEYIIKTSDLIVKCSHYHEKPILDRNSHLIVEKRSHGQGKETVEFELDLLSGWGAVAPKNEFNPFSSICWKRYTEGAHLDSIRNFYCKF